MAEYAHIIYFLWQEGAELAEGDGHEVDQQTHEDAADDQQEEQDEYWWLSPFTTVISLFFNMWELLKDFIFSSWFIFCPKTEHMKQPSWIAAPSQFLFFVSLCSLFNVFCDFWWTPVANKLRPSQEFPWTVLVKKSKSKATVDVMKCWIWDR